MGKYAVVVGLCMLSACAGCTGKRAVAPGQPLAVRQPDPTPQRPIVFRKTDRGAEVLFGGNGGNAQRILLCGANTSYAISPSGTLAACVSFEPQTRARWVTFFDRFGEVKANVLLPPMPPQAIPLFGHGLNIVLSDQMEAVVSLDHEPFYDAVPDPKKRIKNVVEKFYVASSGVVKPIPADEAEGVDVLLPPSGGLALLRVHTDYRAHDGDRTQWTLERYAKGFQLLWKKDGRAYGVHPAGYKHDVSLNVCHVPVTGTRYEYLHFRADGTVEVQPLMPATTSMPASQHSPKTAG